MEIEIDWSYVVDGDDQLDYCRVLYAYVHPETEEILYIGKADSCSVKERLKGKHKNEIFEYLRAEFGITSMGLLVGEIIIPEGRKYSSELLSNIESLLIYSLQPSANIQGIYSRISRPGLTISCTGHWPNEYMVFIDN